MCGSPLQDQILFSLRFIGGNIWGIFYDWGTEFLQFIFYSLFIYISWYYGLAKYDQTGPVPQMLQNMPYTNKRMRKVSKLMLDARTNTR